MLLDAQNYSVLYIDDGCPRVQDARIECMLVSTTRVPPTSPDVEDKMLDIFESQGGAEEWFGAKPMGWLERRAAELLEAA